MRFPLLTTIAALACLSQAADYSVAFDGETSTAEVQVRLTSGTATVFRMPAWSPGDYRIVDYGRHVRDVRFTRDGETVSHTKADTNTWQAADAADD